VIERDISIHISSYLPLNLSFCELARLRYAANVYLTPFRVCQYIFAKTFEGIYPYGFSPTASLSSRSRNFCTSSAIAYFSSSIPLPVTAEISYNFSFFLLQ